VGTDEDIAQDLADGRTPLQNDLAHWGAFIADTPVKIGLSVVIAGLFLWRLRRWREAVMIGLPLIFEATAFIITTYIVKRPRPDVERLLDSPVNSSFPSGHVAAATVYAALVVIVFWHVRSGVVRAVAVLLAAAAPVIVAWARMYQGMHYLTDVVAGMVLGVVSIAICARVLGPPDDAVTPVSTTSDGPAAIVSDRPAS
ncbi:MAG: phosphatase PAP2 family protein, partial [Ilumatobacter sp.]